MEARAIEKEAPLFFLSCRYLERVTGVIKGYFCSSRPEQHPVAPGNNEEQSSAMENNETQQVSLSSAGLS